MFQRHLLIFFLLAWLPDGSGAASGDSSHRWSYEVTFQGLLSAGLPVDIADIQVQLEAPDEQAQRKALVRLSTELHSAAELVMPTRFCYRNRMRDDASATFGAQWRSRIGGKASRGELHFDQPGKRVIRLHVERKLEQDEKEVSSGDIIPTSARSSRPNQDRDVAAVSGDVPPMDRLSMLFWLRGQPLETGRVLTPSVTNGRGLDSYRIEVEGVESIDWNGQKTDTFRIRLEPRYRDDKTPHTTHLWLTRDQRRLPVLFRGSRVFGSIEARLRPEAAQLADCRIAEADDLVLPEP